MNLPLKQAVVILLTSALTGNSLAINEITHGRLGPQNVNGQNLLTCQALAEKTLSDSRATIPLVGLLRNSVMGAAMAGTYWNHAALLVAGVPLPPSDHDRIFGPLQDGTIEFTGQNTGHKYRVRVRSERAARGEGWFRLELYEPGTRKQRNVGYLSVHYDPAWPSLTILKTKIEHPYQEEALRRQVMVYLIKHLKPLTRLSLGLEGSETVDSFISQLHLGLQIPFDRDPAERYQLLIQELTAKMKVAAQRGQLPAELSGFDSNLQIIFAQSQLAPLLKEAGIDILHDLHLIVSQDHLTIETVVGLKAFVQERYGAAASIASLASLRAFLNAYTVRLQISPPPAVIVEALNSLQNGTAEIDDLYKYLEFLQRKLQKSETAFAGQPEKTRELLQNPSYHAIELSSFLGSHDAMAKILRGQAPVLEDALALSWVFKAKEYDDALIALLDQIESFFRQAGDNPQPNFDQWPLLQEAYRNHPEEQKLFIPILQAGLTMARAGIGNGFKNLPILMDLYAQLQKDKPRRAKLLLSKAQAYWAHLLIVHDGFLTSELLGAVDETRIYRHKTKKEANDEMLEVSQKDFWSLAAFKLMGWRRKNERIWQFIQNEIIPRHLTAIEKDPRIVFRILGLFTGEGLLSESEAMHMALYHLMAQPEFSDAQLASLKIMQRVQFQEILDKLSEKLETGDRAILSWAFNAIRDIAQGRGENDKERRSA